LEEGSPWDLFKRCERKIRRSPKSVWRGHLKIFGEEGVFLDYKESVFIFHGFLGLVW